jgi:hypothetical protein
MLIIATKYMDASMDTKKIPILTKNPTIGGSPAIENKTVLKNKAKILLDLFNEFKSARSLFCFLMYLCFKRSTKKMDQIHKPATIYKKR